ncbi:MAG: phosphodiester glycosidase family protein [Cytophagaceae bacterium]
MSSVNFQNRRLQFFFLILLAGLISFRPASTPHTKILCYHADLRTQELKLYWKDDQGKIFGSFQNLKNYLTKNDKTLIFAMNGGMYSKSQSPQGLYIENLKQLSPLDTASGNGNFYMRPNGVFGWTSDKKPFVCKTEDFGKLKNVAYATQSGPLLLIDGKIHSQLKEGSKNLNIRNGVGILPNVKLLFAMSEKEINFYDFAMYFKNAGCKDALYLDGFVSRCYLPEKNWLQLDGNFGVIIGITETK